MAKSLDTFWEWVLIRMEEVGISSIRELARRAGVSHGTINAQRNQLKAPTVETAEGLCRALRVDWVELWTQAGYVERLSQAEVSPAPDQLTGLDAEIYHVLQDTGDDFKGALLKTVRIWLVLYEELRK
ncbi:MAG TPA: helix-turn-helix transcriptional regulator [Anaerolineae bacterium]